VEGGSGRQADFACRGEVASPITPRRWAINSSKPGPTRSAALNTGTGR
jgi:hypothetical protein